MVVPGSGAEPGVAGAPGVPGAPGCGTIPPGTPPGMPGRAPGFAPMPGRCGAAGMSVTSTNSTSKIRSDFAGIPG